MKPSTQVNHPPQVDLAEGNRPVIAPVYHSVKFEFADLDDTLRYQRGERQGFFYSRSGNPTTRQLELTLAGLQGREDCICTSTGIAAVAQTLLALTKAGDHIVYFLESYAPTRYIIRKILSRFGVEATILSIEDMAGLEQLLQQRQTQALIFESPTNPVTKVADIEALTRLARQHGVTTVMDNTFAGFHQHGQYPVDIFIHSLTKYASGCGDVMGGAVIANREFMQRLRSDFLLFGGALDPHAAFLIQRGMRSYFLRYAAQSQQAQQVAEFLQGHAAVAGVYYPGLSTHPQHALARAQMQHFGTVVSLELKGGAAAGQQFCDALQLFSLTPSVGSGESLIMAPQMLECHDFTAAQRQQAGISSGTVRLSIGLEDGADLLADLQQALAQIKS
jgi:cystathionine beta-lyase/cystathionine gamma-synthase